jgi:hypothetical protein
MVYILSQKTDYPSLDKQIQNVAPDFDGAKLPFSSLLFKVNVIYGTNGCFIHSIITVMSKKSSSWSGAGKDFVKILGSIEVIPYSWFGSKSCPLQGAFTQ